MGERHIFVRFKECNLDCAYCDEKNKESSFITTDDLSARVIAINNQKGPHPFVAFTGGEPLLYVSAIKDLFAKLQGLSFGFYLETNGTLPDSFKKVSDYIDVVAMDIKLASVGRGISMFGEHHEFLTLALGREVFVKIVVSQGVDRQEFMEAVNLIASIGPDIPLVLQPEDQSFFSTSRHGLLNLMFNLQASALTRLRDVRVLPRLHKVLGIK